MYTVTTDAGNVYVTDSNNNQINYKDSDFMQEIYDDNSLLVGDDADAVNQILAYVTQKINDANAEPSAYVPSYLNEQAVLATQQAPEDQ